MIVRSYENRIPACSCKSTCNCIIKCSALSCLFSVLNRYLNCNFPHFSAILTLELLQLTSLQVIPPHIIFIFLIKILISISLCFSLFMNIFFNLCCIIARCTSIPCWSYICIGSITLQHTCSCYPSGICCHFKSMIITSVVNSLLQLFKIQHIKNILLEFYHEL